MREFLSLLTPSNTVAPWCIVVTLVWGNYVDRDKQSTLSTLNNKDTDTCIYQETILDIEFLTRV